MKKKRLSVMVPALNEEKNLEDTIKTIFQSSIQNNLNNFEILIFDDGSTDRTGEIAENLAKKDKKIRVVRNSSNRGMGFCYRAGQKIAKYEYYMYIPGDNQFPHYALSSMIEKIGTADIIIPFVTNMNIRPLIRQIISRSFTVIFNLLFNLNVTYYNAPVIHKLKLLKKVPQNENSGHAYQAEILVRLLKSGASFTEIGYDMYERSAGKTTAFKLKNIKRVFLTVIPLFWKIQILGKPPIKLW